MFAICAHYHWLAEIQICWGLCESKVWFIFCVGQCSGKYHVILDCVITALDCISLSFIIACANKERSISVYFVDVCFDTCAITVVVLWEYLTVATWEYLSQIELNGPGSRTVNNAITFHWHHREYVGNFHHLLLWYENSSSCNQCLTAQSCVCVYMCVVFCVCL